MAIIEGYLLGLFLVILIGPVLFVLLNISLTQGRIHGTAVALGIFLSDVCLVWLLFHGSTALSLTENLKHILSLTGGVIVASLGLRYLYFPQGLYPINQSIKVDLSLLSAFIKGIAVNAINPFVFAVWIGIIGMARQRYPNQDDQVAFLIASTLGILTLDLSKVMLADRVRIYLSPTRFTDIQKCVGLLLLIFSARLFWQSH